MSRVIYKNNPLTQADHKLVVREQLSLFTGQKQYAGDLSVYEKLFELLKGDLSFHNQLSNYLSHNFHSFPAKFPPQLPKLFIEALTEPGDTILDPMLGSGTTIIEAYTAGRKGIGFDIDPLAIRIARVKVTSLKKNEVVRLGSQIYHKAKTEFIDNKKKLAGLLGEFFDSRTKAFLDYWFLKDTQLELFSLWKQISKIDETDYRNFFEIVFSSLIITKSGGVSLALDLGHTRPHKIKALLDASGNVIYGDKNFNISKKNYQSKYLKSSFEEFRKRLKQNINSILTRSNNHKISCICFGDSQKLALADESVDLIITSPPYASNAIDYMRAHKFSLVWFGYKIDDLTRKRNEYIGAEATTSYSFEHLPEKTSNKIAEVAAIDVNRGKVLYRYFSEIKRSLREMQRVLKPGKAAIVVVGSSLMKGIDTETHLCLSEIGKSVGFLEPVIGIRELDRNKRMLPASKIKNNTSQIQQRMHEEYVIGFYKP